MTPRTETLCAGSCASGCCALRIFYPTAGETLNQLAIAVGQASPCACVALYVDGQAAAQTYADACGHWQVSLGQALGEGPHCLCAASGRSCADQVEIIIDKGATPVPPPVISYPGALIEDPSPLIRGTARPGDTVRVCVDDNACGTVTAGQDGTWSWQYPGVLEEGLHIVTAVAIGPDGRESGTAHQIFRYQLPQEFSVVLEGAHQGGDFRTVGLDLVVTGTAYPVTLHYLLLPPGSPAPTAEEIKNYTGPGLGDGTAASGSVLISSGGRQTIDISGLENAPAGALGLVDGYRYDVYLVAENGAEQSPVLSAQNVRAMPFAGGAGVEADPYRIRQLSREEIAQKYPDLSAARSPLGVDDTARLLRNVENMGLLFRESGGARGVRNSMGLDYRLVTPMDLVGYAAADNGQGWTALGYRGDETRPTPFTGSLSGGGGETPIRGLTILRDSVHRQEGLFAFGNHANFKDLALENVSIVLNASQDQFYGTTWIGSLAAQLEGGIVDGITVSGARITLTGSDDIDPRVGGIAGEIICALTARDLTGERLAISVSSEWNSGITGGLFGRMESEEGTDHITVENAAVSASTVEGQESVGGIAGELRGFRVLRDITVRGSTVSGIYGVGGLFGYLRRRNTGDPGLIEGLSSEGNTVTAEYSYAAGIAAYASVEELNIQDSHVSGCAVQSGEGDYGGFLGYIDIYGAVAFSRCSVTDCRITGTEGNFSVAGFAGTIENEEDSAPRFLDCTVRDTEIAVEGQGFRIAGFVGYLLRHQGGIFERCHVLGGAIRSTASEVGGFAGEVELWDEGALTLTDCGVRLTGELSCEGYGGGFIGRLDANSETDVRLDGCVCQMDVRCMNRGAGGFVSFCSRGIFTRCRASGAVSARREAGGFVGASHGEDGSGGYGVQFLQCAASGAVRQSQNEDYGRSGGFGGILSGTYMKECFATGAVSADMEDCGGLAGMLSEHCLVEDCYASGGVSSSGDRVGGVFGVVAGFNTVVNRCYSQGAVSGGANTGGLGGLKRGGGAWEIEHSLVLSPSISGMTPTARAVNSVALLEKNYATTLTVLQDQVQKPIVDDPGGPDGGTITAAEITATMRSLGWPDTVWDYGSVSGGNGPKLLNNPED